MGEWRFCVSCETMHIVDLIVLTFYLLGMLSVGFYFLRKNKNADDYYVGGRSLGSFQVGLSVVATDVGGGFSIGLGGLGFLMGLSGSWMLFTGLIGAWMAAVLLIPKVSRLPGFRDLYTFPQVFGHFYSPKVALLAGIISGIGYAGFTSAQILAGAKLASSAFVGLNMRTALLVMGVIIVAYTSFGGIKAVIYTDVIQWLILMVGLIFVAIPLGYRSVGGYAGISEAVAPEMLSFTNVKWQSLVNWGFTIIPIWFVGMTLYQRIYACRDERTARRAWFIAGLFEWPVMAMMGVLLGLFSKVAADQGMFAELGYLTSEGLDPEMGLPMLLRTVLPVGLLGLVLTAYFSAIMSTADSCLMASSGNAVSDIFGRHLSMRGDSKRVLRLSQTMTLVIGGLAILLATAMENVLELMLYSYAFMVSGLVVPLVGGFYWRRSSSVGAFWAMLTGGGTTLVLTLLKFDLPLGLDPNIFGIGASLLVFVGLTLLFPKQQTPMATEVNPHPEY